MGQCARGRVLSGVAPFSHACRHVDVVVVACSFRVVGIKFGLNYRQQLHRTNGLTLSACVHQRACARMYKHACACTVDNLAHSAAKPIRCGVQRVRLAHVVKLMHAADNMQQTTCSRQHAADNFSAASVRCHLVELIDRKLFELKLRAEISIPSQRHSSNSRREPQSSEYW